MFETNSCLIIYFSNRQLLLHSLPVKAMPILELLSFPRQMKDSDLMLWEAKNKIRLYTYLVLFQVPIDFIEELAEYNKVFCCYVSKLKLIEYDEILF